MGTPGITSGNAPFNSLPVRIETSEKKSAVREGLRAYLSLKLYSFTALV